MIKDVLCERAIRNSNKTFITYQNKQISYSQFIATEKVFFVSCSLCTKRSALARI